MWQRRASLGAKGGAGISDLKSQISNLRSLGWSIGLGASLALLGGCADHRVGGRPGDVFHDVEAPRPVHRMIEAQASAGAREDATLYPHHFDGEQLNSLGRTKLTLMATDHPRHLPLIVYADFPAETPANDAHEQAVQRYLQTIRPPIREMQWEEGPNPETFHPAAPELRRLPRTEIEPRRRTGLEGR